MIKMYKMYLENEQKSVNTINSYLRHIDGFFHWYENSFGGEFEKLYRQNVLEFRSYLQNIKKDSARTINAKLSALIKFNEFLQSEGIQNEIVISKKDTIKFQEQFASPAIIEKREVESFRQKVLQHEGIRNYAIVTIMAFAGLRISEVLDLCLDDINLISSEITVRSGKGNKQRVVYTNYKINESIKEYLKTKKKSNKEYLFLSKRDERLDRTVINKMFKKYSDKITPHTLRHFYCSNALECGYSIHELANQAGHSNVHTTLKYTNPTKNMMKTKANLL